MTIDYDWCRECQSLHKRGKHNPEFYACEEDDFEPADDPSVWASVVRASDPEDAALRYAEIYDEDSPCIVGGHIVVIMVAKIAPGEPEWKRFRVSGEFVRSYNATEVED